MYDIFLCSLDVVIVQSQALHDDGDDGDYEDDDDADDYVSVDICQTFPYHSPISAHSFGAKKVTKKL